ncbi:MAG: hypothetical protein KatS3mg111_1335 [Pirellulaceae bacterium]|nr:MAG: hypothetical protein KatS3mg111_1335 [Pirellulaceae bacterium]
MRRERKKVWGKKGVLCALWLSLVPTPTWAHPGHAVETISTDSAWHWILHPDHAVGWLVFVVVAWMVWRRWTHRLWRIN